MSRRIFTISFLVVVIGSSSAVGEALAFNRGERVIVSTDIGGSDEDDIQSMIHFLMYADLLDIEGLISSPPQAGRKADILKVIDAYEVDYPKLKNVSEKFPPPDVLREISKQGAMDPAPAAGYDQPTEGSEWIIQQAHKDDSRPLYVLVWGSITDVAQALHDDPGIKNRIRVYFISSWNRRSDPHSFDYINEHHPDTWMIQCETTFRGWYVGGNQTGDLGNESFVAEHIQGHGALGNTFYPLKNRQIKMGDTPSVAWLMTGNLDDPTQPSWGGSFVKKEGRRHWWTDRPDSTLQEGNYQGAKTVNRWREAYLRDWQKRLDWLK